MRQVRTRGNKKPRLQRTISVTGPPIVGITNSVVKTDSLEEIHRFCTGLLGYDEMFKRRRPVPSDEASILSFELNSSSVFI
jgi:hypothetical protein